MPDRSRVTRSAAAAGVTVAITTGLLTMPASASAATEGQPTSIFKCSNTGYEQFAPGAVKRELEITYPLKSPQVVAVKFNPFPKDPGRCPDPAFPYLAEFSWTPTQAGGVQFRFCTTGVYLPGGSCSEMNYLVVQPAHAPTPTPTPTIASMPTAPRAVRAMATPGRVKVSWRPPASTGAQPITQYLVESVPGGDSCVTAQLSCTVTGLVPGKQYRFSVTASNASGSGKAVLSAPVRAR